MPKKKPTCFQCVKKLTPVEQSIVCKCAHRFCARHRAYTEHACVDDDRHATPSAVTFAKVVHI